MRPLVGNRIDWSKERLEAMRAKGWGCVRIGKELGCDHTTVLHAMKRLGIPTSNTLAPVSGSLMVDWDELTSNAGAAA